MTDRPQDAELRARFDAQRQAEATKAPAFAPMMERARAIAATTSPAGAPRPLTLRRLGYVGGLAAAAVIATLLIVPRTRSNEAAFEQAVREFQSDPALGAWRSPTDGLLNVPGSQLISTVPSVGTQ